MFSQSSEDALSCKIPLSLCRGRWQINKNSPLPRVLITFWTTAQQRSLMWPCDTHKLPPSVHILHDVIVCVRTCINTQYCLSLFGWTLPGVLKCVCVCTCSCSISLACLHQFVLLYLNGCVTCGWVVGVGFNLFFVPHTSVLTLGVARSKCRSSLTAAPTAFHSGLTSSQLETFSFFS